MKNFLYISVLFLMGCTITRHSVTVNEYPCDSDSTKSVQYNNNFIINRDTIKPNKK